MSKGGGAFGDIDSDPGANVQVPSGTKAGPAPAWKWDANYDSSTPTSTAQDVSTSASTENCWSDYTAQHIKMDKAAQLAIRNKAFNAAKPNSDTSLPGFEASEPED